MTMNHPRWVGWVHALLACALLAIAAPAIAKDQPASGKGGEAPAVRIPEKLTPEQADALLARLTDAQARQLLAQQLHQEAAKQAGAKSKGGGGFGVWLVQLRKSLEGSGEGLGKRYALAAEGWALLPAALASSVDKVSNGRGATGLAIQFAALFAILGAAGLARWAVRRTVLRRHEAAERSADAGYAARLGAAFLRFALELIPLAVFAAVALALAYLLFAQGSGEREFHIAYVTGAILIAGAALVSRLMFSPDLPALRVISIGDAAAAFLHQWLLRIVAVAVIAWLTAGLLILTGVPLKAHLAMVLITGALVALMLLAMVLDGRAAVAAEIRGADDAAAGPWRRRFADTWHWFAIVYLLLIWMYWARSMLDQGPSTLWAAIASVAIVLVFPLLDRWIGRGIDDLLGSGLKQPQQGQRHAYAGLMQGAMRVLLAVTLFAGVNELWGFNTFGEVQVRLRQALLASSFDLLAALLLAVLGWQLVKIGIDRRLAPHEVDGVMVEPSARMRTLLPLARRFIMVVLVVMTLMLVLSALGVNIGPLLAGAGVVGLAIGFGAQTLVRDIITGVFFILDDAFRVGEYVVAGTYKGTVESIGIRAVKLRHHRGSIYTLPFGELRAIQNMSRDWVIDKLSIGITYDSDLEKAKKLIKQVGKDLAQDPEMGPKILEPLKMQGVEQFGDFAIQIRAKIKTAPGEQFVIRRRAYAMIKKAFDQNGIKFAFPTVQVAGSGDAAAVAAARQGLGLTQPPAA